MAYTLERDGDREEQRYWLAFLRDEFPAYGALWSAYVVSLTGRPHHVWFKSDAELAKIGRGPEDVCNAQLHYTTFKHLARVYDLRASGFTTEHEFVEALVRLAAATDVADELLQRMTHRGDYDAWAEGAHARREWRKAHDYPVQEVRDYRNRLLHGRLLPHIETHIIGSLPHEVLVPGLTRDTISAPKLQTEDSYLDWRALLGPDKDVARAFDRDFDLAENIVKDAWDRVLAYLEREWERTLIPSV